MSHFDEIVKEHYVPRTELNKSLSMIQNDVNLHEVTPPHPFPD